jgi:hypothetical protein
LGLKFQHKKSPVVSRARIVIFYRIHNHPVSGLMTAATAKMRALIAAGNSLFLAGIAAAMVSVHTFMGADILCIILFITDVFKKQKTRAFAGPGFEFLLFQIQIREALHNLLTATIATAIFKLVIFIVLTQAIKIFEIQKIFDLSVFRSAIRK